MQRRDISIYLEDATRAKLFHVATALDRSRAWVVGRLILDYADSLLKRYGRRNETTIR